MMIAIIICVYDKRKKVEKIRTAQRAVRGPKTTTTQADRQVNIKEEERLGRKIYLVWF